MTDQTEGNAKRRRLLSAVVLGCLCVSLAQFDFDGLSATEGGWLLLVVVVNLGYLVVARWTRGSSMGLAAYALVRTGGFALISASVPYAIFAWIVLEQSVAYVALPIGANALVVLQIDSYRSISERESTGKDGKPMPYLLIFAVVCLLSTQRALNSSEIAFFNEFGLVFALYLSVFVLLPLTGYWVSTRTNDGGALAALLTVVLTFLSPIYLFAYLAVLAGLLFGGPSLLLHFIGQVALILFQFEAYVAVSNGVKAAKERQPNVERLSASATS